MKKILGVLAVCVLTCVLLLGCTGASTIAPAWADEETLTYKITNSKSNETVGSMTVRNIRRPDDKTLNGKEYNADGKTVIDITLGEKTVKVTFLTKQYTVLAEEKIIKEGEKETKINAYHSGKNAFYTIDGGEEKKIKTGNTGYTESEYLYNYIRCYALPTVPGVVKIADYLTGTTKTVNCSAYASAELSVPYPDGEKKKQCTVIAVSLADTPTGEAIYVWYTPDDESSNVSGVSISPSKKFPVKIVENDLTYTMVSMSVK